MTLTRDKLTYATLVISESAWLYAFASILGVAAGSNSGSPLSYFAIVGLLGLSVLTYSYIRWKNFQAFELFYFFATVGGVALAYLVVAASYVPGSFDIAWITSLTRGDYLQEGQAFRGTAGGLIAIGMWFRGVRLAMVPYPEKSLTTSFRFGLFFIGLSAVIDIFVEQQLNVFTMILIFFGAGLAGLNIGHLVPETAASSQMRIWPKAIGGAVAGVLVVGLLFGFLQQSFLSFIFSPIRFVFDRITQGIFIIVSVPFVLALEAINSVIGGVFSREIDPSEILGDAEPTPTPESFITPLPIRGVGGSDVEQASGFMLLVRQYISYALVAAALILVAIFLYIIMRRIAKRLRRDEDPERESLLDEISFASDIGDLFADLMSNVADMFKRGARKVFRLPAGPPGVVEALRLYYQMLTTAEQNDVARPDHATPTEFRSDLRRVFANDLVDPATHAFNRAQYGDIPSTDEEIAKMRSAFRVVKSGERVQQTEVGGTSREARFETVTSEITDTPLSTARFDSPSLSERSWFSGGIGVTLACGGFILFALLAAFALAVVILVAG